MSGLLSHSGDRSAVGINMRVLLAVAAILAIGVSAAAAGDPVGRYTSYWIDSKTGRGQSTVVVRQIGSHTGSNGATVAAMVPVSASLTAI
jgi:hypothetical protein